MFHVYLVVREAGGLKPEYALEFDLPELPRVGSYLSVEQSGDASGRTEDLIVRQVWWRVVHPARDITHSGTDHGSIGRLSGIVIECAKAIGPYSTEAWKEDLLAAERAGFDIETFEVETRPGGFAFAPAEPVSKAAVRRVRRRSKEVVSAPLSRLDSRRRQH